MEQTSCQEAESPVHRKSQGAAARCERMESNRGAIRFHSHRYRLACRWEAAARGPQQKKAGTLAAPGSRPVGEGRRRNTSAADQREWLRLSLGHIDFCLEDRNPLAVADVDKPAAGGEGGTELSLGVGRRCLPAAVGVGADEQQPCPG